MGEKRHKCDVYGKEFSQCSHLQTHQKVHTVEKQFKCEQCGKGFSWTSTLPVHCKVHTGERPYTCEEVGGPSFMLPISRTISESALGRRLSDGIDAVRPSTAGRHFIIIASAHRREALQMGGVWEAFHW
jgi:hypothetical protein